MDRITLEEASSIGFTTAKEYFSKENNNSNDWNARIPSTVLKSNEGILQYQCIVEFIKGNFVIPFSVYIDANNGVVNGVERLKPTSPKVGFKFIKNLGIIFSSISILEVVISEILNFGGYSFINNGPLMSYTPIWATLILVILVILGLILSFVSYEKPKLTGVIFIFLGYFALFLSRNYGSFLPTIPTITGIFYIIGGIVNLASKQKAKVDN